MGSDAGRGHQEWYRLIAKYYSSLWPRAHRERDAAAFFDDLFRRKGEVRDVLDVACGPFGIGLALAQRGYGVAGRDLSAEMLRVATLNLRARRLTADLGRADMRDLRVARLFDAVLCLGTAFNYLIEANEVARTLRGFHRHLRPGGLLVLDLANFDAWIDDHPMNARAEMEVHARDGTRIAVFAFNEQRRRKTIHIARFLTIVQRGKTVDIRFDEAPLKVWRKEALARELSRFGFRPSEWWGDLKTGSRYARRESPRLVSVATRA